jgi:hypothetical protein
MKLAYEHWEVKRCSLQVAGREGREDRVLERAGECPMPFPGSLPAIQVQNSGFATVTVSG